MKVAISTDPVVQAPAITYGGIERIVALLLGEMRDSGGAIQ